MICSCESVVIWLQETDHQHETVQCSKRRIKSAVLVVDLTRQASFRSGPISCVLGDWLRGAAWWHPHMLSFFADYHYVFRVCVCVFRIVVCILWTTWYVLANPLQYVVWSCLIQTSVSISFLVWSCLIQTSVSISFVGNWDQVVKCWWCICGSLHNNAGRKCCWWGISWLLVMLWWCSVGVCCDLTFKSRPQDY